METVDRSDAPKFYTTNEIAELLKMNVQVIARKLQCGEIAGYKIGKDWRVKDSDLMEWLEKHSNRNAQNPVEQVIKRFMKNGRFETFPAQYKRRKYIIEYILKQFELNKVYLEKEVNEIISLFHDDYCRVRRDFVDEGMMHRQNGKYRRNASYLFTK
jgi:excisionase family DNA binding protein